MLILSDSFDENTYRAARNVKPVLLATATDVNTEQLLAFDKILVTDDSAGTTGGKDLARMNEHYDIIQTVR